jgi:hypothetical protein
MDWWMLQENKYAELQDKCSLVLELKFWGSYGCHNVVEATPQWGRGRQQPSIQICKDQHVEQ